MKKFVYLTLCLGAFASAQAAGNGTVSTPISAVSTSALAPMVVTRLEGNAKLDKTLKVVLPSGAPLSVVLSAIAKASGLSLIQRDVPAQPVTLNVTGMSIGNALERLLNLYGDQVAGQLIGDTLIVAPPQAIARLDQPKTGQDILNQATSSDDASRIAALTGAQVVPLRQVTIVSGTDAQRTGAARLLQANAQAPAQAGSTGEESQKVFAVSESLGNVESDVAERTIKALHEGVQATSAYGRIYLQARSEEVLRAASKTMTQLREDAPARSLKAQVADDTERRTISTLLAADVFNRLVTATGGVEAMPLESGAYRVQGTKAALDDFASALKGAEAREAMRVTVTYAGGLDEDLSGLKALVPNASVRLTSGGIEVRGTPQEQLRASSYLGSLGRKSKPAEEQTSVRLSLAYANPVTVAAQLASLYGDGAAQGQNAVQEAQTPQPQQAAAPQANTTPIAQSNATNTLTGGVRILVDERTRGLILSGPVSQVERVQRTVSDLDIRMNDIRMALKIEQVSGSNGQDLGLSWSVGAGGLSVGQKDGTLQGGFTPGLKPLSFEASLQVARTQGRVNTLLDTSFVSQDGRTSTFSNGGQLVLPNTSTTTTNGSTTSNTTRESYNYGLEVSLTPRLAPDGRVEVDVRVQLGQAPRPGVQNGVVIEKQTLATLVNVAPGESLVLGGILQKSQNDSSKGVPGLSDIPVLGALFGNKTTSNDTSVLLITLQAGNREDSRAPSAPSGAGVTRVTLPGH